MLPLSRGTGVNMAQAQIKRFLLLDKSPFEAWALLTDPKHLEKWYCDKAQVETKPGGAFGFFGNCVVGGGTQTHFSRYEQGEALAFPWDIFGVTTLVNWTLEKQLDMSRV